MADFGASTSLVSATMWKRVVAALVGGLLAAGALALLDDHPAPRPEGTIAYSAPDFQDVLIARADGSGVRRLTSAAGPQFDPSFSPDGSMIAYRDSRHGINQDDEIWVMDRDGGHARNLTRDRGNDWSPAWSPDGRAIAFASTRSGSLELWTMMSDGSNPKRLSSSHAEYPSWSPDGSRIALSLVTAGAVQIGVIGRGGHDERTLTPLTENSELPAWSPDGRYIVFARRQLLMIMRADGSSAPSGVSGSLPAWTS